MNKKTRNLTLNLLSLVALGVFLWWAPNNLDGYKLRIINLIAINAILGLTFPPMLLGVVVAPNRLPETPA